ncbi:MAG: hypothetical protein ACRD4C_03655 [Candidatus Acidiferrales bacterium]
MKLTREQSQKFLNERGIWITEACDKCGRLLGSVRWTRKGEPGEWCSAACRDGVKAERTTPTSVELSATVKPNPQATPAQTDLDNLRTTHSTHRLSGPGANEVQAATDKVKKLNQAIATFRSQRGKILNTARTDPSKAADMMDALTQKSQDAFMGGSSPAEPSKPSGADVQVPGADGKMYWGNSKTKQVLGPVQ